MRYLLILLLNYYIIILPYLRQYVNRIEKDLYRKYPPFSVWYNELIELNKIMKRKHTKRKYKSYYHNIKI